MKTKSAGRFVRFWATVVFVLKTALLLVLFYFTSEKFLQMMVSRVVQANMPIQNEVISISLPYYTIIHIVVFAILFLFLVFNYCKLVMFAEIAEDIAGIRDDVEMIRNKE